MVILCLQKYINTIVEYIVYMLLCIFHIKAYCVYVYTDDGHNIKMNWIDKLLPVLTLVLGWGLSQFSKFWTDKKNDQKKLKKLLFNLLELRWLLKREIDLNKDITIYTERLKTKLTTTFGQEAAQGADLAKPILTEVLKNNLVDPNRIKEIESNIDFTINELAEIYPVFAYELSGQYKIKERIESLESYFNEVEDFLSQMPKELTDWVQPKITDDLLKDIDGYIIEIAEKINRKTKSKVTDKLKSKTDDNSKELDEFIDEYIKKIKNYG